MDYQELNTNHRIFGKVFNEEEDNVIFSPLSLHTIFSILLQDPSYRNENDLSVTFYQSDTILNRYKELLCGDSSESGTWKSFNKLLFCNEKQLEETFKSVIKKFHYENESTDFTETENVTQYINSWILEKTTNLLRDVITSSNMKASTLLGFLSATNFTGKWANPFNLASSLMTFHTNRTIEIPFLALSGEVNYADDQYTPFKAIELPFTSEDISLFVFLPNKHNRDENIIYRITDWIVQLTQGMRKENMDVSLPKFELEKLLDCKNIFSDLGSIHEDRNFFGMLQNGEFLKCSEFNNKAFISVNEEGVVASNGIVSTLVPFNPNNQITVNDELKISKININTTVSNRFTKTLVTCNVQNTTTSSKQAKFNMILPERAFITEFIMEIDGRQHKSYIKGKQEAKQIYDEALSVGKSAGLVETNVRDSNNFNVSVNLEPQSVAVFLLTYEEMLQRVCDQYEIVSNVCPGQIVDDLTVEVSIKESRPLRFVRTPPLRTGKEMNHKIEKYLVPSSDIQMIDTNTATVKFLVNAQEQAKLSLYMGNKVSEGFSGQFIVQYDVERDPKDGEILLQDGYFVHFFAPNDLDPLPKHVVFILDTSGSMEGRKLAQLKDAMKSILSEVRKGDMISIIEFNSKVIVWDIESEVPKSIDQSDFVSFEKPLDIRDELSLPKPVITTSEIINNAKKVVQKIVAGGCTFMIGGLQTALHLVSKGQKIINKNSKYQPLIVFLTDGEPNAGVHLPSVIVQLVTQLNLENKVPIFSLSFGEQADKSFLRELSLKNFGFSRHIYEASDASLQLQFFYKQISSPLLCDIKFKYDSNVEDVTKSDFPIYFKGSELVISGRCKACQVCSTIEGNGPNGCLNLRSVMKNPVTSLERLWAYLTVKQLLDQRNILEDKEKLTEKAVDLALKYSFVTDVTSLVVVKPDEKVDANLPKVYPEVIIEELPEDLSIVTIGNGQCKKKILSKRMIKKRKGDIRENTDILCINEEEWSKQSKKKLEFIVNRPFLIALVSKSENARTILFLAWITNPLTQLCHI